jgi:hypothetical protein
MKAHDFLVIIFCLSNILFSQTSNTAWQEYKSRMYDTVMEKRSQSENTASGYNNKKISAGKVFFYSLLIPGLGEATLKKGGYTKFFLSVETILWGIYVTNRLKVKWNTQDYKSYAAQHAGINGRGKDDQYWINIGKYDNIYAYNEQRRKDRNVQEIYQNEADDYWYWDNKEDRLYYDEKRIKTRQMEIRNTYFIGGIILNHVVSAINALRLARKHNRHLKDLTWELDFQMDQESGTTTLSLIRKF